MMIPRGDSGFSSSAHWEASQASCVVLGQSACTAGVAVALLRILTGSGLRAVGMMPVAARDDHSLRVLEALGAAGAFALPTAAICPFMVGETPGNRPMHRDGAVALETVVDAYRALATWSDGVVVVAPGEVTCPMAASFSVCDLARELALPTVLVADTGGQGRHAACATAQALRDCAIPLAGWVAVSRVHSGRPGFSRRLAASLLGTFVPGCHARQGGRGAAHFLSQRPACQARFDVTAVLRALGARGA